MKKLLFFLALISFTACSITENNANEQFYGTWKDVESYDGIREVNGVIDSVSFPNIIYKFFADGKFEISNEIPWGVPSNGTWEYNEFSELLTMTPNTPDNELGINRTYMWEIISITDQTLEVTFKYWGAPLEEGKDPIQLELYRKFEKQ